jgi:hypothetical protein
MNDYGIVPVLCTESIIYLRFQLFTIVYHQIICPNVKIHQCLLNQHHGQKDEHLPVGDSFIDHQIAVADFSKNQGSCICTFLSTR